MFSSRDATWNEELKQHTCCGSKHSYHYSGCVNRNSIPGRMSDPDFQAVQDLKAQGISSGDVARRLNMPLAQVNDLWLL